MYVYIGRWSLATVHIGENGIYVWGTLKCGYMSPTSRAWNRLETRKLLQGSHKTCHVCLVRFYVNLPYVCPRNGPVRPSRPDSSTLCHVLAKFCKRYSDTQEIKHESMYCRPTRVDTRHEDLRNVFSLNYTINVFEMSNHKQHNVLL
jgi:hypothetical protein